MRVENRAASQVGKVNKSLGTRPEQGKKERRKKKEGKPAEWLWGKGDYAREAFPQLSLVELPTDTMESMGLLI